MAKSIAVDLHYFPNLEFFAAISGADELVFFPNDAYRRQSFFNRTRIRLANKVGTLSVPVQGRRPKISQRQILIDNSQNWLNIHLRTLQSAYGKAPFYEFYFPYFEDVIRHSHRYLWELNWGLLTICLKLLGMTVKMRVEEFDHIGSYEADIRGQLVPSVPYLERNCYESAPYFQLFGSDFDPNLSVLDLLFCEGTAAKSIILMSVKKQ